MIYKIGKIENDKRVPLIFSDIYAIEKTSGPERLVIAPSGKQISLIVELMSQLLEPFGILYVLPIPRNTRFNPGRYQVKAPIAQSELELFLWTFQEYFEKDSRHSIWITSLPESITIVYDNHNLIYVYGKIEKFKTVLENLGLKEGRIVLPSPHTHFYNVEFDDTEIELMSYFEWYQFPLEDYDDL